MELPETFWTAARLVGGFSLFVLGISFAMKFFNAAFLGKVAYWAGLEKFGFLFAPLTLFISPFVIHLPYDPKKSLIHERQQLWVHLIFGPAFFVATLMCMTSGLDLMNLPGSTTLNTVLTLGRHDVPACIVYSPPFTYRFPFVKKATKTVLKALTIKVPEDKKKSYNAYEQQGQSVEQYSRNEYSEWFDDDVPVQPHTAASAPKKK
jgi:hypothetical protein